MRIVFPRLQAKRLAATHQRERGKASPRPADAGRTSNESQSSAVGSSRATLTHRGGAAVWWAAPLKDSRASSVALEQHI